MMRADDGGSASTVSIGFSLLQLIPTLGVAL